MREHDPVGCFLAGLSERFLHDGPQDRRDALDDLDLALAEDHRVDDPEPALRCPFDRLGPQRDEALGLAADDELALGIQDDEARHPGQPVDEECLRRAVVERDRGRGVRRPVVDRQGPAHAASTDAWRPCDLGGAQHARTAHNGRPEPTDGECA